MAAADTIKEIHIDVKRCAECGARFGIEAAFCPFDGVPLSTSTWDRAGDPRAHIIVDDRYEVLEPIGEGGMGTVYRVRHITLDRHFAMKVLRRDLAADTGLAARFLQEAKATAAIKHANVVAITDFGEMEDGAPYFVMELLEGETLATRIRARGPIPPQTAIRIAKAIADGLAACHAASVIHRDLKPDNVFLVGKSAGKASEDEIRIVDFGAAKVVGGSKLTKPGIVFGTPYYMSPEQASGHPLDARADIYSLGILLYEMVTGQVPFEADTYMGVLTKHIFQAPARPCTPSGVRLGPLEDVVMRALQKEPADRYDSMTAFSYALRQAEAGKSEPPAAARGVPTLIIGSGDRGAPHVGALSTADRIQLSVSKRVAAETQRKRRLVLIGIAAGLTAIASGVVVAAVATPSTADAPEATAAVSIALPSPSSAPPARPSNVSPLPTASASSTSDEPSLGSTSTLPPSATVGLSSGTSSPVKRPLPTTSAVTTGRAKSSSTSSPPGLPPGPTAPTPASRTDDFKDPWKR